MLANVWLYNGQKIKALYKSSKFLSVEKNLNLKHKFNFNQSSDLNRLGEKKLIVHGHQHI